MIFSTNSDEHVSAVEALQNSAAPHSANPENFTAMKTLCTKLTVFTSGSNFLLKPFDALFGRDSHTLHCLDLAVISRRYR